jgi:hypothetical protein
MTSSFSWLDYSEQDRRKMLDVISLFHEPTTRDELGIASIRNAFSDLFFPETSTIQTRAKYFLFISWIYRDLIEHKVPAHQVEARLRKQEISLIETLMDAGDHEGIIGKVAGANLKRLPSNIYWYGLGSWGIRKFRGSQPDYHAEFTVSSRATLKTDDGKDVSAHYFDWDVHLPPTPPSFPGKASFKLTVEEAEYLADRICQSHPQSLLTHLMRLRKPLHGEVYAWTHPDLHEFPPVLQEQLTHACNFSDVIYGANLLYRLMLAKEKRDEVLVAAYLGQFALWADAIEGKVDVLQEWDRRAFWQLVNEQGNPIGMRTQGFVDWWFDLVLGSENLRSIEENPDAHIRIKERELALKGAQARLGNPRALELWQGNPDREYQLDFRWFSISKHLLNDILSALTQEDHHVAA